MKKCIFISILLLFSLAFADNIVLAKLQNNLKCSDFSLAKATVLESFNIYNKNIPKGSTIIGTNKSCLVRWDKIILSDNNTINIEKHTVVSEVLPIAYTKKSPNAIAVSGSQFKINVYLADPQVIINKKP